MQKIINDIFLESAKVKFSYYKDLGEKAIQQLQPSQLFISSNEDSNSIAMIVQHLSGNMISRWTDFLATDGEKEWRKRDAEFEAVLKTKEEVMQCWEAGWACLFNALNQLQSNQLQEIIFIRNEAHTVIEAIIRQLSHYPYHVGQIIFYAKMLTAKDWENLSMPKKKK
ncbi:MAG: DUF1572 family protein [Ferruginibacter sp.]